MFSDVIFVERFHHFDDGINEYENYNRSISLFINNLFNKKIDNLLRNTILLF